MSERSSSGSIQVSDARYNLSPAEQAAFKDSLLKEAKPHDVGALATSAVDKKPDVRKGWYSLETICVYWGVREGNISTVNLLSPPTGRRRALIPYLHSGLGSMPEDRSGERPSESPGSKTAEPRFIDPVTILAVVSAFVQFLKIVLPVVIQAWKDLQKFLTERNGDGTPKMTDGYTTPDENRDRKQEIIIAGQQQGRDFNPKVANECLPTQGAGRYGELAEPTPAQAGMGIVCTGPDGAYQLLGNPDLAQHLTDPTTSNYGWGIEPYTQQISFQFLSRAPGANGGQLWGAYRLYEQE